MQYFQSFKQRQKCIGDLLLMKVLLPKSPTSLLNFQSEVWLFLLIEYSLVEEYSPKQIGVFYFWVFWSVVVAVVVAIDGPGFSMHEEYLIGLELDEDHPSLIDLVHCQLYKYN